MNIMILSLHERWWKKMLAGEKRLEIRKTHPTRKGPFRVLVYVAGTGEVQGEFVCHGFLKVKTMEGKTLPEESSLSKAGKESCLTEDQLKAYAGSSRKQLWGWLVSDVKKYDTPRRIELYGLKRPPQSWQYYDYQEERHVKG